MRRIAGYTVLSQIYESVNSLVFKARSGDGQPTILKVLKQDYPSPDELTRYRQEYEITRSFSAEGVIKAHAQLPYQQTLVIALEDFGGSSLQLLSNKAALDIDTFLSYGIKICLALSSIHDGAIIHKDINPGNIVVNQETGQLKIIDFGISTRLSKESPIFSNPSAIAGTLPYISPEQTGRMNCLLDYRTDLYSLGITFYQLLAGCLPFASAHAQTLIHDHLVNEAMPLKQIREEVPEALCRIVNRLMRKRPEERYQSASGVQADLLECRQQWQCSARVFTFELGRQDTPHRFEIPGKLYGRDEEQEQLMVAYNKMGEKSALMLIAGYSGVGKTALVQSLYKPITTKKGIFISGKFDQLQKSIPYTALTSALRDLVRQLLTSTPQRLAIWKEELLRVLGPNGQILIEVVPELVYVIGEQPVVLELGPEETRNRFNMTFLKFMASFCRADHPLTMFLDDLQWADAASLNLLELMLLDDKCNHLFLIGAYRDNEVDNNHPLMFCRNHLKQAGVEIAEIALKPLNVHYLNQLVSDAMNQPLERVRPFSELIETKTGGNPFFVNQFLQNLYMKGLITYGVSETGPCWHWNQAGVEALEITENVVDLMRGKLKELPEVSRQILKLASCMGNQFNLATLAVIAQCSQVDAYERLVPVIRGNFILPQSKLEAIGDSPSETVLVIQRFKFLHDRVQQAAYALIEDAHKMEVHYKIGCLLLEQTSEEKLGEQVFELADHLNMGYQFVQARDERLTLARLNKLAGIKALESTAYESARTYLAQSLKYLGEHRWEDHYEMTFEVNMKLAFAEYLSGNTQETREIMDATLAKARTANDKVKVHIFGEIYYTQTSQWEQAIDEGCNAMALMGNKLPTEQLEDVIKQEYDAAVENLGDREIVSLVDAKDISNAQAREMVEILSEMASASHLANPHLNQVVILKIVNISLLHGNVPASAMGYAIYAFLLAGKYLEHQKAYAFGQLAMLLCSKYGDLKQTCQAYCIIHHFVHHWMRPIRDSYVHYEKGYTAGMHSGNLTWSAYSVTLLGKDRYFQGENLEELLDGYFADSMAFVRKFENQFCIHNLNAFIFAAASLREDEPEIDYLSPTACEPFRDECREMGIFFVLHDSFVAQMQVLFIFGEYERALEIGKDAYETRLYSLGSFVNAELNFYHSLTLIAYYGFGTKTLTDEAAITLQENQDLMKSWLSNCKENFEHKYLLIEAGRAFLGNRLLEAEELYDQAIVLARKHGFPQDEAIAHENAGLYWLARGKEKFAAIYLRDAYQCYRNWGAHRKTRQLERVYGRIMGDMGQKRSAPIDTGITQTLESGLNIDLSTVIDAAKMIREQCTLDDLVRQVIKISLENAGAEKGTLVLKRGDNLVIKGRATFQKETRVELMSLDLNDTQDISHGMVHYVARTGEALIMDNACTSTRFMDDPYVQKQKCQSVLCIPLHNQGTLLAIVFLENNKVTGAFNSDRMAILHLLMAPAAIAIENALLKDSEENEAFAYNVGGSLPNGSSCYVLREADRTLYKHINNGDFCFILNSRQMGKSSLRVRTSQRLAADNICQVSIDLTLLGSSHTTMEQWYAGLARVILSDLGLAAKVKLRKWWREHNHLPPVARISLLFDKEILSHITNHIVIFIDEVDSVLGLDFDSADFFAMIRAFYNKRADDDRYQRLGFVLIGVALPSDLIGNPLQTPFNIGKSIALSGFRLMETAPLHAGLREKNVAPGEILKSVLAWTKGQPFLTQKVCWLLQQAETKPTKDSVSTWVATIIRKRIIDNWIQQDEPEHFKTISSRILGLPMDRSRALLELYGKILTEDTPTNDDKALLEELCLTGLVSNHWGRFQVSNPIYREIFDIHWQQRELANLMAHK